MKTRVLTVLLLLLPALLGGCHIIRHSKSDKVEQVPPGGADFGILFHFDHVYAERNISSPSDLDGFEFTLAQSSVILITTTASVGLDPFLDLYDRDFEFIIGDDDGGPGSDAIIVATLSAGDYFVVVGSLGGTTGDYDIDISIEPLGGGDFGVLFPPETAFDDNGLFSGTDDVDSYIFTVYEPVECNIFLQGLSGDYDGNLQLLTEYGQELAFVDPGHADPVILGQLLQPGTYIVRAGSSFGSGSYSIQIDVD